MKFGLAKMGQMFLGWLPTIILAIPSIWLLASVPPLWRDIDGYNQVTLPPGAMTILQFSPLYSFGARLPLYAGCALDAFFAHDGLPGWEFFAHPILSDHGVFLLVALQHILLLRAQTFLLHTVSTTSLVQVFLSALLAFNSSFYTLALLAPASQSSALEILDHWPAHHYVSMTARSPTDDNRASGRSESRSR